jgi:signal transduction histidine kinase
MHDPLSKDLAAVARIDVVPQILAVVTQLTGMGFAAVARVTSERWLACAVRDELSFGLAPGGELELRTTICNEIRQSGQIVVIDHVSEDRVFCAHPTPRQYGFESYISVPIFRPGGEFFGTLCALDPKPASVNTAQTVATFKLFADLVGFHLDAQDRLASSEAALSDASESAELRERFIAVLGHDLRNPLSSIDAGARLLERMVDDGKAAPIIAVIKRSAARMAGLIGHMLDFSRGRLGGGIPVRRTLETGLGETLSQIVAELQSVRPDRVIDVELDLHTPVYCDGARIAQLFSNLLGNALTHGAPELPVKVRARTEKGMFELSVANGGPAIPPEAVEHIFQPFKRSSVPSSAPGLGLGLFIASEIARAHEATLEFTSQPDDTRFVLRMPTGRLAALPTAGC